MGGKNAAIIFDDVDLDKCLPVLLRLFEYSLFLCHRSEIICFQVMFSEFGSNMSVYESSVCPARHLQAITR
jgi:hypothetical protein